MALQRPKKRSRYTTGIHISPKCLLPFEYRSGWELLVAQVFDADPNVVVYAYEAIGVPYKTNYRTGRVRKYFPDFLVQYASGRRLIVEVKRDDKARSPLVLKKAQACSEWAAKSNVDYEIWTSKEIKEARRLLGLSTEMSIPKPQTIKKPAKKKT